MKIIFKNNFWISLCILISTLYLLIVFFYPTTRDEFYYLDKSVDSFKEYYNSYLQVNARIGQFFSNLMGRNMFFKILLSGFIFLGFFYMLFVLTFRKTISLKNKQEIKWLFIIAGLFIFLINYFGEMFFYVPYSANYTLLNVFYMFYVSIITGYYIYQHDILLKYKVPLWLLFMVGLFIGMGNEHVPPTLLLFTALFVIIKAIKSKKIIFPPKQIFILSIAILIGYCVLFLAPANKVRLQKEGKEGLGFNISTYADNLLSIFKIYFHYNFELLIFMVAVFIYSIIYRKMFSKKLLMEIASFFAMGFVAALVSAYSPIVGTRLLFFSNVLFITCCLIIIFRENLAHFESKKIFHCGLMLSVIFICVYFSSALVISFKAQANFKYVLNDIAMQSKVSPDVIIKKEFDYTNLFFGKYTRKVLLDTGLGYIDSDSASNTSVERNIIEFYHLRSLSKKESE